MIGDFKIVDGHVHTFISDEVSSKIIQSFNKAYSIQFENPGTGTINNVLENMNRIGIDYTIMANFAPAKILHENNMWALRVSRDNSRLIALVSFHPDMEGDMPELLSNYIKNGARGIKIHPMAQGFEPNDERMKDLYEHCNEISFPIVFHCGRVSNARLNSYADINAILPVIEKYSYMPVILTHMADGNKDDVTSIAKAYKNVYFDTSIVISGYDQILENNDASWIEDSDVERIVNIVGADRILFGSDYPWGSPYHDINRILKLNLSNEQKKLILSQNTINVFKIE